MNEDEARRVELVRAVETEDRGATLLTREDRQQADGHARRDSDPGAAAGQQRFLVRRAEFAAARLTTRHPGLAKLLQQSRWPRWIGWTIPGVALLAGFLANEFGTDKRLDLLAAPLLGTIGWNVLVYLWLVAAALAGAGRAPIRPVLAALAKVSGAAARDVDRDMPVHRAAAAFRQRWAELSARLTNARVARTLHLAAALFAAGLIGGIYLRALIIEYRAGWESTFLGPDAVHALLAVVLGPASLASGVAVPPADDIAAMHWTGPTTGGVNAGRWIHLYTVTLVGAVVVPRLLLAAWQAAKSLTLARRFPLPGREDFYIRRIMRAAGAKRGAARVTPYAYRPGEETRRRLKAALGAALGDSAEVRFDEPIDYGAEETWLAEQDLNSADDYHIVLFSMSATPEAENHGALAAALNKRIAAQQPGTVVVGVVDESPFRGRFAGQAGLQERISVRSDLWRKILTDAGVPMLALDLLQNVDEGLAEQLEGGLLQDGGLCR